MRIFFNICGQFEKKQKNLYKTGNFYSHLAEIRSANRKGIVPFSNNSGINVDDIEN